MATGLVKNVSIVAVNTESTENTAVAPASATDGYIQPLEDGFQLVPSRELVEREVLSSSVGSVTPRTGLKGVSVTLPIELKASGVEGTAPDADVLYKGALGASRSISGNNTTKASGNTGSVLQIEDADIGEFTVGDIILIKESGGHHVCAVTAKTSGAGTATITVSPAKASGSFSNSVVISKSTTYYTASSGHPSLTANFYWGNEIREYASGCKVTSFNIEGFETGGLAQASFQLEGLNFTQVDGAAPHTPTFDAGIPPIILSSCVYIDGVQVDINALTISLTNELGTITSTCSSAGKTSQRITNREISGTLNPYKDDTSVANWTKFNNNTEFSLFAYTQIPSSTAGEMTMGSVIGMYFPKCIITELQVADQEGILVDQIGFRAVRGSDGASEEMYLGFI